MAVADGNEWGWLSDAKRDTWALSLLPSRVVEEAHGKRRDGAHKPRWATGTERY